MSAERRRNRIVAVFVLANLVQDLFVTVGNVLQGLANGCQSLIVTFNFVKYDQARKYRDLTGGDLGEVVGCPGHFTGDCQHAREEEPDGA